MTNSRDDDGEGSGENREEQNRQRGGRRLLRRPPPSAPRPEAALPEYTPPLPAYPDQRVYNVRMGDQDMQPVSMSPEQAINHLTSMGFQVHLSERERRAVARDDRRLLGDAHSLGQRLVRPPRYQLDDRHDGALLAVRPIDEYAENQPYDAEDLPYMPENVGRNQAPTMGLAIHERDELSGEDRARLLEIQRASAELDWIDGNIAPRYTSALEKIGQIYQDDPAVYAERSDSLQARVSEFRRTFDLSLRNDEPDDLENAPAGDRAAQEQPRGRELPLSSDARRLVIEELDEMLAEHFPETHVPDRPRQQTPAVAVEAADEQMNVAVNDRSRASTVVPDSQEELEQYAQPRDMPTPPTPDFRSLEETFAEHFSEGYAPDRSGQSTLAAARNAEVEVVDLTAEESSQEGSRSHPARQHEPDPFALTEAQQAFLARWPHYRQPTFEEMHRLMDDERPSSPANTADNREASNQPESGRARPPKRTRDDAASGEESPGDGPSRPVQRRRLISGARASLSTDTGQDREPFRQPEGGRIRPLNRTRDDDAPGEASAGEGPSRPVQRRRLMSGARPSSSADTGHDLGPLRQPESGRARPPKRARDDDRSGEMSAGEGPSRPVQRRRLMPSVQPEPRLEPAEIREGGSQNNERAHGRNREDRRNAGVEPAIEASGENRTDPGSNTARVAQSARQAEAWRQLFDRDRRGRDNGGDRGR